MIKKHDGGPAFPQHDLSAYGMGPSEIGNGGMTLRDWFAGKIIAQIFSSSGLPVTNDAETAYKVADAMLAVREQTND